MSDGTGIGYCQATWPLVTGCEHTSEGCDHCFAAALTSGRLKHLPAYAGLAEHGRFNGTVRLLPDRLDWPLHWPKSRRIFISDMADLSGGLTILNCASSQVKRHECGLRHVRQVSRTGVAGR